MECEEWLKQRLNRAEFLLCDYAREEAKQQGFTRKQLKEARKKIGVKTFHQFDEFGDTGNYFWYLDEEENA